MKIPNFCLNGNFGPKRSSVESSSFQALFAMGSAFGPYQKLQQLVDDSKTAIIIRTPNEDGLDYQLDGDPGKFKDVPKSADWGPMAGRVPVKISYSKLQKLLLKEGAILSQDSLNALLHDKALHLKMQEKIAGEDSSAGVAQLSLTQKKVLKQLDARMWQTFIRGGYFFIHRNKPNMVIMQPL